MKVIVRPKYAITSCGKEKAPGAARADQFYRGPDVRLQAEAARAINPTGGRLILSNKYGLMRPSFVIPGPYDSHWGYPDTMSDQDLAKQVRSMGIEAGDTVVILGTSEYARQTRRMMPREVQVIWPPLHLQDRRPGYQRQLNRYIARLGQLPTICVNNCVMPFAE